MIIRTLDLNFMGWLTLNAAFVLTRSEEAHGRA
jgi:hypothetical protein